MKGERRIRRIVKSVTYKPDTWFEVERSGDNLSLGLFLKTIEPISPHTPFTVSLYWTITEDTFKNDSDEEIRRSLILCLALLELHELAEWLRFDGERAINPHPHDRLHGEYPIEPYLSFKEWVYTAAGLSED